jgi:hypothetical protein
MAKPIDPARALTEMRTAIDQIINDARLAGVRSYQLAEVLENAATAIRVRHAATAPIL